MRVKVRVGEAEYRGAERGGLALGHGAQQVEERTQRLVDALHAAAAAAAAGAGAAAGAAAGAGAGGLRRG